MTQIDNVWAAKLGITGPQWLILSALADANDNSGAPVNKLAKTLRVDPSFITTQTKLLEQSGLLVRKASTEDARVVLIRASDKFLKLWEELSSRRLNVHRFVFSKLQVGDINRLTEVLSKIDSSLKIAATLTDLDADESLSDL